MGVVAGGGVLAGSVVPDALLRVCLESLRGGLVIWVVFPGANIRGANPTYDSILA